MAQNTEAQLLASAARSATISTADQDNQEFSGLVAFFDVSAVPGGDTVQLTIEAKDPISGTYTPIVTAAATAAIAHQVVSVYPGATDAAGALTAQNDVLLPKTWRATVTHSGAGSFTYSLALALID